jgi:hypothetical protein
MKRFLSSILVAGLSSSWPVLAREIQVPGDYTSVLEGLDAAVAGDSVLVGPGVWTERDTRLVTIVDVTYLIRANGFLKSGVSLIGISGADQTVLRADDSSEEFQRVLQLPDQGGIGDVLVEGLTLEGMGPPNVGIDGHLAGSISVVSCQFRDVVCGARVSYCDLRIYDSSMEDCHTEGIPGLDGACVNMHTGDLYVEGCRFGGNDGPNIIFGTGFHPHGMRLIENLFTGNEGRTVFASEFTPLMISDNVFLESTVTETASGMVLSVTDCDGDIVRNLIAGSRNLGPAGSGVVRISGTSVSFRDNTVWDSEYPAGSSCAGVVLRVDEPFVFRNNIVANCRGGPAVRQLGDEHPSGGCNVFWDNPDGHLDGYSPWDTDTIANPLFCDPDNSDFTLHANSPCIPGGISGCGQVGAYGVGCGAISVEDLSWGSIKGRYRDDSRKRGK